MGILVGNTTVIEHAGIYIEFAYTHQQIKYSPVKASIGFVLPKGIPLSDGYLLARAIVYVQLGIKIEKYRKANELCLAVFGEPLKNLEPDHGIPKNGFKEVPGRRGQLDPSNHENSYYNEGSFAHE